MSRLSLTIARLLLCLWVGGAALFVVTSIAEQRFPFPETVKNQLALIRFPWYYSFGFTLVGGTLIAGHFARRHRDLDGAPRLAVPALLSLSMILMTVDHHHVYRPLAQSITPPDRTRTEAFERLHTASKWINLTHVGLALAAAVLLCRSGRSDPSDGSRPPRPSLSPPQSTPT